MYRQTITVYRLCIDKLYIVQTITELQTIDIDSYRQRIDRTIDINKDIMLSLLY